MTTPHVQLIVDRDTTPPPSLRAALDRVQARISIRSLDKAISAGVSPTADMCVVLPAADRPAHTLDDFLTTTSNQACAAMVIPSESPQTASGPIRIAALPETTVPVIDRRLQPDPTGTTHLNADEITGRIRALCEIRHPLRRMREEIAELRHHRDSTDGLGAHMSEQIRLASQIQKDLLPRKVEDIAPLEVNQLYVPADFVSGDTYDISRLDEHRFGFSIADATGHGLPAALLAILVKNSLRGKEIVNGSYRIIEPDELLARLNQEMLANHLQQCHFITALHAIFDRTTGTMRWARGGIPYPILIRPDEPPRQIRSNGGLIGAFEDQTFEAIECQLQPGDTLLFYTDGLEAMLLERERSCTDAAILTTPWLERLAEDGPESAFEEIELLASSLSDDAWPRDDITALAIRMAGPAS